MYDLMGKFVGYAAVTAVAIVMRGFVLSQLWGWFVVPALLVPSIGIPVGMGLALLYTWISTKPNHAEYESKYGVGQQLVMSIFYALLVLGFGFVIHLFV